MLLKLKCILGLVATTLKKDWTQEEQVFGGHWYLKVYKIVISCLLMFYMVSSFLHKHVLVKYSGSMENIGTSHEHMPLMSLGSCMVASLPYVQSWRGSIIRGYDNWWKLVWGGAHFWSLDVAHFPRTHTYKKNWSSSSSKSPIDNTIYIT
jgi:hypothetical protein